MITPAQFNLFVTTANTAIGAAYQMEMPVAYDKFCTTVPSQSTQNAYAWTGMLPKMREWFGPRVTYEPAPQTYVLVNQAFEGPNVTIDRFRLDDDRAMFDVYWRTLADMARQAKRQPDYMFRDLLENSGSQTGTKQIGMDGVAGFSTSHPVDFYDTGKGTYSNDFTGGGANVTYNAPGGGTTSINVGGAFSSPGAVFTLAEYMMTLKGEDGESLGVVPNMLLIHPQLKGEAEVLLKNQYFAPPSWGTITGQVGAAENALKRFGLDFVVNPLLTQAYTWYMCDTTKSWKPFTYQLREPVVFTPRVNEQDPVVYDNHAYMWGQWGRMAIGWSYPWLYVRSGP